MGAKRSGWKAAFYITGCMILALIAASLLFPQASLSAALRGLDIWWDVLFPALMPFFVISEMLLGFGIVHFIGTILDPMMRPVFRVPGIGGFVMAMGFASGYPIGARLTSQLWEQGLVTREEGERLVAFTTTSDPIFLIGAVSVGFFHDTYLAVILGTAHYGSALAIGLLMRFHGAGKQPSYAAVAHTAAAGSGAPLLRKAFDAMHTARTQDGRTLGKLLSDSMQKSLTMMFVVGGLVVFFSVILELLTSAGAMSAFAAGLRELLGVLHLPAKLADPLINGLFEVTLGAKTAGSAAQVALVYKVAAAAFILSWAGLSVHAQVVSLLSHTNLRYAPFVWARLAHGVLAAVFVLLLWEPLQRLRPGAAAAFAPLFGYGAGAGGAGSNALQHLGLQHLPAGAALFIATLVAIVTLYAFYTFVNRLLGRKTKPE